MLYVFHDIHALQTSETKEHWLQRYAFTAVHWKVITLILFATSRRYLDKSIHQRLLDILHGSRTSFSGTLMQVSFTPE